MLDEEFQKGRHTDRTGAVSIWFNEHPRLKSPFSIVTPKIKYGSIVLFNDDPHLREITENFLMKWNFRNPSSLFEVFHEVASESQGGTWPTTTGRNQIYRDSKKYWGALNIPSCSCWMRWIKITIFTLGQNRRGGREDRRVYIDITSVWMANSGCFALLACNVHWQWRRWYLVTAGKKQQQCDWIGLN